MIKQPKKRWIFEAATVEEAIEKATTELSCSRDLICVKVVSEEKKGLFGMQGASLAKIVVTVKEKEEK
jgi:predicted RNA-binding protein Jag